MSRPVINCVTLGRFGNQMCQYAFARAYAFRHGCEFRVNPWIGEQVFQLDDAHIQESLPRRTELTANHEANIEFSTYAQTHEAMIYSKAEAQSWFKFRPEIEDWLQKLLPTAPVLAHRRVGDYLGYGYPVVSKASYYQCCKTYGLPEPEFVTEEDRTIMPCLPDQCAEFLPDFYRLMHAPILLRGNSTYSWWAATLSDGVVYAPVIDRLVGGQEHDCSFVPGNWPRLTNLEHTTDMPIANFHESLRYEYALTPESRVIDIGAHHGNWCFEIAKRYKCRVDAWEPIAAFQAIIAQRNTEASTVCLHQAGVGPNNETAIFHIKGDSTGRFADGPEETVQLVDISLVIPKEGCDLIKINIEGGEYDLLDAMLDRGLVTACHNIQVQFHGNHDAPRYPGIRDRLLLTHHLTYHHPFCWENYERNS